MAAARAATLPARGPDDHDLAVPSTPHVQHVLTLLSMILLVLSVLLVPMQLHFFFDMPILNQSLQRLPEVVIIVFLAVYSSDTIHLTIMQLDDRLAPLLDYDNCKPNNMTNINMPLRCARHSTGRNICCACSSTCSR